MIVIVAVLVPVAVGSNATLAVQLAPAARLLMPVHVSVRPVKSPGLVPSIAIALMLIGALPTFVSVSVWAGAVVVTFHFPNFSAWALSPSHGPGVPVPDKGTD